MQKLMGDEGWGGGGGLFFSTDPKCLWNLVPGESSVNTDMACSGVSQTFL